MRKEGIHTGLGRGRIEDELRLPILLLHGIGTTHDDRAVGFAVRSHPQAEQAEVNSERQNTRSQYTDNRTHKDSLEPLPEFGRCQRHEARL